MKPKKKLIPQIIVKSDTSSQDLIKSVKTIKLSTKKIKPKKCQNNSVKSDSHLYFKKNKKMSKPEKKQFTNFSANLGKEIIGKPFNLESFQKSMKNNAENVLKSSEHKGKKTNLADSLKLSKNK